EAYLRPLAVLLLAGSPPESLSFEGVCREGGFCPLVRLVVAAPVDGAAGQRKGPEARQHLLPFRPARLERGQPRTGMVRLRRPAHADPPPARPDLQKRP